MRKYSFIMLCFCLLIGNASIAQKSELPLWKTIPEIPAMPNSDDNGFAKVNGIKMYYAIYNKSGKNPVILLHGGLGSSDDWGFETPLLLKTHEVIVVDCRGRGRSTMSDQPLSYDLMTSDLLGLMDQLHLEKVSIVGVSDGGVIGLLMAIHHRERINKLFAYGANFNNTGYKTGQPDTASSHRYLKIAEATYRKVSPTPGGFAEMRKALFKMYDTEPDIKPSEIQTIKTATVIADGEYEQFITPEHTRLLAHLIPGATLLIIPNVSHGGPIQDPVSFHKAVMKLLN
jgi:pimeloyl-ACP methyl ester carboxylesterase